MGLKSYENFLRSGNIIEPSYDNFLKQTARRDPYFNLTSLLLHGDGTNATQNNTFLDSSTNNFTITRNGNPTQGTISPYGNNWSNYFDGSGDYLSIGSNAAFSPGTGDFTLETFVYLNALPSTNSIIPFAQNDAVGTSTNDKFWFGILNDAGTLKLTLGRHGTSTRSTVNWTPSIGVWYHVAVSRQSGTTLLFIDGIQQTVTDSTAFNGVSLGQNGFAFGAISTPYYLNGYLSNLRYVIGTAQYTSTFTPPTSPLTAVANTSLLTCQSNRLVDNSSNNFTITRNGDVSVQKFSPFSPTAAYSSGSFGGSGYFDGSGDYLTIANNTAFNLSGTTYTIEGWINPNGNYSAYRTIIAKRSGDTAATNSWEVYLRISSGVLSFYNATNYESSVTPTANAWNYFAAVFDGTNINLYLNGSRVLQSAITNADTNATIYVGSYPTYSENFIGYISDLKITKGSALYSGTTMSVPTSPLTSSDNTSLLLNFTNAAIRDNTGFNNLETVGNAQISTAQSKFGGSSMYFDGTNDYLASISQTNAFGSENFTIESWCYFIDGTANALRMIWTNYNTWTSQSIFFGKHTAYSGKVTLWVNNYSASAPLLVDPNLPPANSWVHYAAVRNGSSWTLYRDGTSVATGTYSGVATTNTLSQVGGNSEASGTYSMYGYLDDFRITKGLARYTTNFTPPTEPFLDL